MFGFLSKKSVGIDISDGSIEIAEITQSKVINLGRRVLEPGIVEGGRIKDEEKLTRAVKDALTRATPRPIMTRHVFFAIPESQVYSRAVKISVSLGALTKNERNERIHEEARQNIPLEDNDLLFTHHILSDGVGGTEILILGASRSVIYEWQEFFHRLKITVDTFDIESLAIARSVLGKSRNIPTCFVDTGTHLTTVTVLDRAGLRYTHSIKIGGASFTKDIAGALEIQDVEAEKQKITLGVTEKNQKGLFVLIKALKPIAEEVITASRVYHRLTGGQIGQVIFVGGASHLPGLLNYFSENITLPVVFGKSVLPLRTPDANITHLEAIGIALKAWDHNDPSLSPANVQGVVSFSFAALKSKFVLRTTLGLLVVVLLGATLGYRIMRRATLVSPPPEHTTPPAVSNDQVLNFVIELAINPGAYTSERVRARIVEVASTGEDALIHSLVEAERDLKSGEQLTKEPLKQSARMIQWVAYSAEDLNQRVNAEINKLILGRSIQYEIQHIEETNLSASGEEVVLMKIRVFISASDTITEKNEPPPHVVPPTSSETRVRVLKTETGYLNVREGPGTSYTLLFRAHPGEVYILIEKRGDWARIRSMDGPSGWANRQYIKEI